VFKKRIIKKPTKYLIFEHLLSARRRVFVHLKTVTPPKMRLGGSAIVLRHV
jgi:hypothetical protein